MKNFFNKIFKLIRRYWIAVSILTAALIGVGAWLFFGVFAFHLALFNIDDKVNEANPFAVVVTQPQEPNSGGTPQTTQPAPTPTTSSSGGTPAPTETISPPQTTQPAPPATQPGATEGPRTNFIRRSHPGEGEAFLLTDGTRTFLRFENFETDNGPGLRVYLSNVSNGVNSPAGEFDDDFYSLGTLKGNVGDQNYEIPPEVDLTKYNTVAIWCDPFNVLFTVAEMPRLSS